MRDLFYDVQTQLADDLGDMEQLAIYAPLDAASPGVRAAVRMHHLNMKRKAPDYIQVWAWWGRWIGACVGVGGAAACKPLPRLHCCTVMVVEQC